VIGSNNQRRENGLHHEGPSVAKPQPKRKCNFYHEGHEDHEVKKFKNIKVRNLRVLRELRGEIEFSDRFGKFKSVHRKNCASRESFQA
jgi:hypothetical protein